MSKKVATHSYVSQRAIAMDQRIPTAARGLKEAYGVIPDEATDVRRVRIENAQNRLQQATREYWRDVATANSMAHHPLHQLLTTQQVQGLLAQAILRLLDELDGKKVYEEQQEAIDSTILELRAARIRARSGNQIPCGGDSTRAAVKLAQNILELKIGPTSVSQFFAPWGSNAQIGPDQSEVQ